MIGETPLTLTAPVSDRVRIAWLVRSALLILALCVERYAILPSGVAGHVIFWQRHTWVRMVPAFEQDIPEILIAAFAAASLTGWNALRDSLRWLTDDTSGMRASSWAWFGGHLLSVAAVLLATALTHDGYELPGWLGWERWVAFRVGLEAAALVTWIFAALPPQFWMRWARLNPQGFALGAIFGPAVKLVGHYARDLWWLFRGSTFWMVAVIMRAFGYHVVANPADNSISLGVFSAKIGGPCTGIEGIGLMVGFVAVYLWWYRRELRFPHALVLLPVGVATVWLFNAMRIAALIMIGNFNGPAAIAGFHSVAGWLSLSIIGCVLVFVSWRVPIFNRLEKHQQASLSENHADFYLAPMLIVIATAMITRIFDHGFDFLYPLRVGAVALVLWFYRSRLAELTWSISGWSAALGALVFVIWIALAPAPDAHFNAAFAAELKSLSLGAMLTWLSFRILGAVVTVPIAEELAFRGYLMRKMVADDFSHVPLTKFTWLSFLGSSILFGALHGEWLAGIIAGMVFAIAVYRRGMLADGITAHATSNALLAIYVLPTHNWLLWT